MYLSHLASLLHWILYLELRIENVLSCRCRAEKLFSERSSKVGRSIRRTEKEYRNIVLFVEDHRNVIQLVISLQYCWCVQDEYKVIMIKWERSLLVSLSQVRSTPSKYMTHCKYQFFLSRLRLDHILLIRQRFCVTKVCGHYSIELQL